MPGGFSSGFSSGFGPAIPQWSAETSTAYKTASDLVLKALLSLGVLAVGQTVAPEDFAIVAAQIDPIFRKLAALEICFTPDPQNIPGEWFLDLAAIVAGECSSDFGAGPEFVAKGLGVPPGTGAAALSLKIMNRGKPTGEVQRAEYF